MVNPLHISNIYNVNQNDKNHFDRYKFLFENSPIPIQETNVKKVSEALMNWRELGITDVEQYLRENLSFLENLYEESNIFDVNQAVLQLFEAESKEDYFEKFKTVLHEPCLEFFKYILISVYNGVNVVVGTAELSTFKGKKIWLEITATYLHREGDEMVNYTFKDITKQKFRDQAISLINKRLVKGTHQEHLNNLVLALSEAFDISHVFIAIRDKCLNSATTLAFAEKGKIIPSVTYALKKAPCFEIYEKQHPIIYENNLDEIYPDNNAIKIWKGKSYLGYPLFDEQGEIIGNFSFVDDKPTTNLEIIQEIMELYAAWASSEFQRLAYHNAQLKTEYTLNTFINNIGDIFCAFDADYNVLFYNQIAKKIFKQAYNINLKIGEKFFSTAIEDEVEKDFQFLSKSFEGKVVDVYKALEVNGEIKHYGLTLSPIIDMDQKVSGCVVVGKDLTKLKIAETKLKQKAETIQDQLQILEQKNQELEKYIESNSQLENFAYIASHDLKAPIRTIVSFSQLLQRSLKDTIDENAKEYLNFVISASKNMKDLIEDLLEYSRINSVKLNPNAITLEDLFYIIQYELKAIIEEKKPIITFKNIPEEITGDYTKIKQVFQNLISNAIKFHKKDELPSIDIACVEEEKHWKFSIKDSGIGISPEYFDRIFVLFQKLHAKNEYEGTGLGLAICKKIIEQHRGEIWVESEVGVGTTFYFTIAKNL